MRAAGRIVGRTLTAGSVGTAIGLAGIVATDDPRQRDVTSASILRSTTFEYDDDGILYYKGYLYGDDADGFEPLDDFGMPNAGCVDIKYKSNNGEWESL